MGVGGRIFLAFALMAIANALDVSILFWMLLFVLFGGPDEKGA